MPLRLLAVLFRTGALAAACSPRSAGNPPAPDASADDAPTADAPAIDAPAFDAPVRGAERGTLGP